jgi:hypothetical protein
MPSSFTGVIKLIGGPLDGLECSVLLSDDEKDELFFDAVAYPIPICMFRSQIHHGMVLFEYRWSQFVGVAAYYHYVDKKHIL